MARYISNKIAFIVLLILFLIGSVLVIFNNEGILKFIKLKNEVNDLNARISQVEQDNKNIKAEIDSLKNKVPAKIEKVAREKYNMIRKGETTIKVIEK